MNRWKAAAIHSSMSIVVALAVGALLFGLWYRPPYFHAAGADELVLLLVGIDLCVGPLLTLIVFRPGKRGLKFDLAVIVMVQAAALVYGLVVVLESRPVFLVAAVDRFELVSASEIADADLAQGREQAFRTRSWSGPRTVALRLPRDPKERNDLVFSAGERGPEYMPKYFVDYAEGGQALLSQAKGLGALRRKNDEADTLVAAWLRRSGRSPDSVRWVPVQARKADLVMLLDATTAEPLQALAIDPW